MEDLGLNTGSQAGSTPDQTDTQTGGDQDSGNASVGSQSESREGESSRNQNGWLQRFLRGGGPQTTALDSDVPTSGDTPADTGSTDSRAVTSKSDQAKPVSSVKSLLDGDPNETLTLTRAEAAKLVQSEKDKSIAAENRRNADMAAMRASATQLQMLRDLSDPLTGDPDKLAEAVQEFINNRDNQASVAARQEEITSQIKAVGQGYDLHIVKPILDMLPPEVSKKIEDEAPEDLYGLDHRVHLFKEGMKALKVAWTNQARSDLRKSEAFRKEVLAIARGQMPEPELVVATGASADRQDANTWLRRALSG